MGKVYKNRFFSLLMGFSLILFVASCVDTAVESIPTSINYTSLVKFVNEVPNDAASITIDGSPAGSVPSGEESAYMEAPSGSRSMTATYPSGPNVDETVFLETDFKIMVTIVEDTIFTIVQDTTIVNQDTTITDVEDTTLTRFFVKSLDGYK